MKLLVATEFPPNASGGGPAVVRQMLRDWPAENLCWWSCQPEADARFGQRMQEHRCSAIPAKLYPQRKFTTLKSALLENFWSPRAAEHLRRTLRELRPDAVWVIPHNWSIPPLAAALADHKVRCHVTVQDYVDVHDNPRRFGLERCARMAAQADALYARAASRDATSHPLAADLRARTGAAAAQILHAGLEAADFDFLARKTAGRAQAIRIAYAGTILVEAEFARFVAALESVRRELPAAVELHLFGAHRYADRQWFNREWMTERGNLDEAALRTALRECDWGFTPMALTDTDPRYNRFSFPTKFITYLAAGLPVITLGHPESSVMKMAARYDVGFSTSTSDVETLATQLQTALTTTSLKERFGGEIIRCARAEFDAQHMRQILHQCFTGGAAQNAR